MTIIRRFLILASFVCLLTSCEPAPTNAPANSNTTVSSASPAPTASPSPANTSTASAEITLPLLDALLTDEKFVARLKQNLKLSEEQIDAIAERATAALVAFLHTLSGGVTEAPPR